MRSYEQILAELYEVFRLKPFSSEKAPALVETTQLVKDLEIDSLKLMELMLEIEDRFEVSIPLNVLPDIITIRDLALKIQALASDTDENL